MPKKLKELDAFLKKSGTRKRAQDAAFRYLSPEYFVDQKLIQFEEYNEKERAYSDTVENYLQREREKLIDDINESFLLNVKNDFEYSGLSRIVNAKFSTYPLCSIGSIKKPPGDRFNFGQSTRFTTNYFQALYLANNYDTAFSESYHSKDEAIGDFAHFKVAVKIDRYLDLRDKKVIKDFFKVVKTITLPDEFIKMAKDLKIEPMSLCKRSSELYNSIFSERYKAWDTWLDQYSPSQWLGFYVYKLGIPAIVYPSIRYKDGFNVAIYTDNFHETENEVRFKTPADWKQVAEDRKYINSANFKELQQSNIRI